MKIDPLLQIYLRDIKTIGNVVIKERYGSGYRAIKRYQKLSKYIVVSVDDKQLTEYEFGRFSSAVKFANNPTYRNAE